MTLQILVYGGIRLNAGIGTVGQAMSPYAANTTLSYPGIPVTSGEVDFKASLYENTLGAISSAWQLGYKVETQVCAHSIMHRNRYIKGDRSKRVDAMSPADIAAVNLSDAGEPLGDGNRIPLLEEVLAEHVRLKQKGLFPEPRMQLELRRPVDVQKAVGAVMQRISAGELAPADVTLASLDYGILTQARTIVEGYDASARPVLSFMVARDALDFTYLDRNAPDYADRLASLAAHAIPVNLETGQLLPEELAVHFPELAGMTDEQVKDAIPGLVQALGTAEFAKRYEALLLLLTGGGLDAGCRLDESALATAPFDMLHIPMDTAAGVIEAYVKKLAGIRFRGGRLRAFAYNVCRRGRYNSQLLRAFVLLDDDAELSLDYPEMIPSVFADILASGSSNRNSKMQVSFDPTRKYRFDGIEFSIADIEKASKRFFDLLSIPYQPVTGAAALIGGGKNRTKLELDMKGDSRRKETGS